MARSSGRGGLHDHAFCGGGDQPDLDHAAGEPGASSSSIQRPALHRHDSLNALKRSSPTRPAAGGGDDAVRACLSAYRGTLAPERPSAPAATTSTPPSSASMTARRPAWLEASDCVRRACHRLRVTRRRASRRQQLNLLPPPIASQDLPGERNTLLSTDEHLHGGCGRGLPDRPLHHHLPGAMRVASRTISYLKHQHHVSGDVRGALHRHPDHQSVHRAGQNPGEQRNPDPAWLARHHAERDAGRG